MDTKQILTPRLGWWFDGMFDLFYAIPDGWVITGTLELPPHANFCDKKIVKAGGIRLSRHFPFPLIVSRAESQKERDTDLGLLLGGDGYAPRFVEFEQYGINSSYSFHWAKIHLNDLSKNGYAGRIEATANVHGNPDLAVTARCVFNLPTRRFNLNSPVRRPTLELEYFPPQGTQEMIQSFLRECSRWKWETAPCETMAQ